MSDPNLVEVVNEVMFYYKFLNVLVCGLYLKNNLIDTNLKKETLYRFKKGWNHFIDDFQTLNYQKKCLVFQP